MRTKILAITALALLSAPLAADGIPVEPGLWSITSTVNMPMMPAPQTVSVEECFDDEVMNMDDIVVEDVDPDCAFEMGEVDGNTMNWTIDCPIEGGTMHAEWEATSSGDSVDGSGVMKMNVMGQSMEVTMTWTGNRVGECN